MNLKIDHIFQTFKNKKVYIVGGCVIVLTTAFLNIVQPGIGYAVTANGEFVGYASNPLQIKAILNDIEKDVKLENGKESSYSLDLEYTPGKISSQNLTNVAEIKENIEGTLDIMVPAVVIKAGSEAVIAVENVETADLILDKIKEPFKNIADDVNVEFAENVEVLSMEQVYKKDIYSQSLALSMVSSNDEVVTRSNIRANDEDSLASLINPLIDVQTTHTFEGIENYTLPVEVIESPYYKEGQTVVYSEGSSGVRDVKKIVTSINNEVVEEEILSENIISEAKAKVVYKGTGELYSSVSAIVNYAETFIGVPYKSGGRTPSGFDCSGFTSYVFNEFGITLPRSSSTQASAGVEVSYSEAVPGDLIIFSGHVGIYVGDGNMIHSPRPGKSVEITSIKTFGKSVRSVRRII